MLKSMGAPHGTPEERFWKKVDKTDDCWLWTAHTIKGYGYFHVGTGLTLQAHRFAYETCVGPISKGLVIDHTCHTLACPGGPTCPHRRCVNPAHLEVVTQGENARRGGLARANRARLNSKTHCINGHEYLPENTYWRKNGGRVCRTCHILRMRRTYAERTKSHH